MALKVSDVQTEFEYLKTDISDVDDSVFVQWSKLIQSYIYRQLKKLESESFISPKSYTISSTAQALPSDFRDMNEAECGIYLLDDDGNVVRRLTVTGVNDNNQGFYLSGTNVVFTNFAGGESATMYYIPKLTQISDVDDYFTVDATVSGVELVPEEFLDYLLQAYDVKYSQWDQDPAMEGNADQRFTRVLDDMLSEYNRTPKVYNLPDISNSF